MANDYYVRGKNSAAPFTLKIHRGEGMCLLAMNWRTGEPPRDFVGFAIEYQEPDSDRFFPVKNRLCFKGKELPANADGSAAQYPSTEAPIQKFRWVHFPRFANLEGDFTYRVTPIFMGADKTLSKGEVQEAKLALWRETYPGIANITFTRGFVSSQAFVDRYAKTGAFSTLIPPDGEHGLEFTPSHPKSEEALAWMGFEARERIHTLLDDALADQANVAMIAYELNLPELVDKLVQFGARLRIIIDDSGTGDKDKGRPGSPESKATARLQASGAQVLRQHMGKLQHNKVIIVDGPNVKAVIYGSTNFSWRGFYVQANNAVVLSGAAVVTQALDAFGGYFTSASNFRSSAAANWRPLSLSGINASINMSPHSTSNAVQAHLAADIGSAKSSVLYSLAFLHQTPGAVTDAIAAATNNDEIFVYGISDKATGIVVQKPDGNLKPVYVAALDKNVPEPFKSETKGGGGNRMHHKFIVVDFNTPSARVYTGSYNFSFAADEMNGENLILFKNRRIATAYMIESLRLVDHYHFRASRAEAKAKQEPMNLKDAPMQANHFPWWQRYYAAPLKMRDRMLFA